MKTLLVGLDNPSGADPQQALYPMPEESAGARLMRLVEDYIGDDYYPDQYLADFERTNLYAEGRAVEGADRLTHDHNAMAALIAMSYIMSVTDIVLLGTRVVYAFNSLRNQSLTWLQSCTVDGLNFHALPHPSGRNRWYCDDRNCELAGELLARLRRRKQIPHRVAS